MEWWEQRDACLLMERLCRSHKMTAHPFSPLVSPALYFQHASLLIHSVKLDPDVMLKQFDCATIFKGSQRLKAHLQRITSRRFSYRRATIFGILSFP